MSAFSWLLSFSDKKFTTGTVKDNCAGSATNSASWERSKTADPAELVESDVSFSEVLPQKEKIWVPWESNESYREVKSVVTLVFPTPTPLLCSLCS